MFESLQHLDRLAAQAWTQTDELQETMRLVELRDSQTTKFDYTTMAGETLKG